MMWTRKELKLRARAALGGSYWWSVLFFAMSAVIISAVSQIGEQLGTVVRLIVHIPVSLDQISAGVMMKGMRSYMEWLYSLTGEAVPQEFINMFSYYSGVRAAFIYIPALLAITCAVGLVVYTFANGHFSVGRKRFFLNGAFGKARFGDIGYAFSHHYLSVAKTSFFYYLILLLGEILIIPGIIFRYQFYFVPYLLAENPGISTGNALKTSRKMAKGNKWRMFLTELSFLGWDIISVFCICGLGSVFLWPYKEATYAQMYLELKERALRGGKISIQEIYGEGEQI